MLITQRMIEAARKQGACQEAIVWLQAKPRTVADLIHNYFDWVEWTDEELLSRKAARTFDRVALSAWDAYVNAPRRGRRQDVSALRAYESAMIPALEQALRTTFRRRPARARHEQAKTR